MAKAKKTEDKDKLKVVTQTEVKNIVESKPDYGWFVLQTYSGKEASAKRSIEDRLKTTEQDKHTGIVLMPEKVSSELRRGVLTNVKKKLYAGYLFIYAKRMKKSDDETKYSLYMDEDVYQAIRGAANIHSFAGQEKDSLPKLISRKDVDNIIGNLQEEGEVEHSVKFKEGVSVKIKEGPFAGFSGVIDKSDCNTGKLVVNITMFQTVTPIDLTFNEVMLNEEEN